jgi:probable rRNA maturation factor
MELEIDWLNEHPIEKVDQQLLDKMQACLIEAARLTDTLTGEFSIMFVDKGKIQEINRDYRSIDRATDVISFALNDNDGELIEPNAYYLGDIVICIDIAKSQAEEYGHSIEREMCFLAVHGLLHLLGYDHQTQVDEDEMFSLQETILANKGL